MSLEEYLGYLGLADPISDALTDKMKGNRMLSTYSGEMKFKKQIKNSVIEYHQRRKMAIQDYWSLVNEGAIIPKSKREKSIATAHGHEDLDSTWAARRMCTKRKFNWQDGNDMDEFETIMMKGSLNMKMTHNEYDIYKREILSKEDDKEAKIKLSDIEILDYDLDKYKLPQHIMNMINGHMDRSEVYSDHETFYGSYPLGKIEEVRKKYDAKLGIHNFSPIGYFKNDEYKMLIIYADGEQSGNLCLSLYYDQETYNQALIVTHNMYEKMDFYYMNVNGVNTERVWSDREKQNLEMFFELRKSEMLKYEQQIAEMYLNDAEDPMSTLKGLRIIDRHNSHFFDFTNDTGINEILIAHPNEPKYSSRWSALQKEILENDYNEQEREVLRNARRDILTLYTYNYHDFVELYAMMRMLNMRNEIDGMLIDDKPQFIKCYDSIAKEFLDLSEQNDYELE